MYSNVTSELTCNQYIHFP